MKRMVMILAAMMVAACGGDTTFHPTPAECDACFKRCADDVNAQARNECDKSCTKDGCEQK